MSRRAHAGRAPAVLLGGGHIGVAVARSLRAAGVPVTVLGSGGDPVRWSRSCDRFVDLGARTGVQERWLDWLLGEPPGSVVLAGHDDALELVAHHRATIVAHGHVVYEADDEVVLTMLDKARTYELARRLGIDAPRTATLDAGTDVDAVAEEVAYPCALKPLHSHIFARHFDTKLLVARDAAELRAAAERTRAHGLQMLVTEIVPGGDAEHVSYYSYLDARGEPVLHFTKRKLRQHPIDFGLGCYHVTARHPECAELGLRFFQGAGVRGLANVEFKRDARDGKLKLIECNHRMTAATEQIRLAGMDLPRIVYERALGLPGPPVDGFREGVRLWYPIQDALAFRAYRREGRTTLRRWVRSLAHRQHFPVARWDDPLPTLAFHAQMVRRRLPQRHAA